MIGPRRLRGIFAAVTVTILIQQAYGPAAIAAEGEGRTRYVEYTASATDRDDWSANVEGEILFYSSARRWKIFGNSEVHTDPHGNTSSYIAVRKNLNHTHLDDDPHARLKAIGHRVNAAMVRAMGTDLLTVQIELDDP